MITANVIARLQMVTTRNDGRPEAAALLLACLPYLKDGETPAECIARNRQDIDTLLLELAKAKSESPSVSDDARQLAEIRKHLNDMVAPDSSACGHVKEAAHFLLAIR